MRKILSILILGLTLIGSCFAEEAILYGEDKNLNMFDALSITIKNPIYITDLPEEMLTYSNTFDCGAEGYRFHNFQLKLDEKDFISLERPVVRIIISVEYDSRGCVTADIRVLTYKNKQYEEEKAIYYSLYCYSLDTWADEKSVLEYLQMYPGLKVVTKSYKEQNNGFKICFYR